MGSRGRGAVRGLRCWARSASSAPTTRRALWLSCAKPAVTAGDERRTMVVGVDGSPGSEAALHWAISARPSVECRCCRLGRVVAAANREHGLRAIGFGGRDQRCRDRRSRRRGATGVGALPRRHVRAGRVGSTGPRSDTRGSRAASCDPRGRNERARRVRRPPPRIGQPALRPPCALPDRDRPLRRRPCSALSRLGVSSSSRRVAP